MCGIAGRLNFRSGAPVDPAVLRGMSDLLAHRGPDGEGLWHAGAVGLAHRRLAVIDPTAAAGQPMTGEDPRVRAVRVVVGELGSPQRHYVAGHRRRS